MQHAFDKRLANRFISADDNDECISLFHALFFVRNMKVSLLRKEKIEKRCNFLESSQTSDPERSTADFALSKRKIYFMCSLYGVKKLLFEKIQKE